MIPSADYKPKKRFYAMPWRFDQVIESSRELEKKIDSYGLQALAVFKQTWKTLSRFALKPWILKAWDVLATISFMKKSASEFSYKPVSDRISEEPI